MTAPKDTLILPEKEYQAIREGRQRAVYLPPETTTDLAPGDVLGFCTYADRETVCAVTVTHVTTHGETIDLRPGARIVSFDVVFDDVALVTDTDIGGGVLHVVEAFEHGPRDEYRDALAEVRRAFDPVADWYGANGEHPEPPLASMVKDAVADLQEDRAKALRFSRFLFDIRDRIGCVGKYYGERVPHFSDILHVIRTEIETLAFQDACIARNQ